MVSGPAVIRSTPATCRKLAGESPSTRKPANRWDGAPNWHAPRREANPLGVGASGPAAHGGS
eukprot:7039559-Alexandrium_andersonii.AAC.1